MREKLKAEREEALALEQSELVKLLEARTENVLPPLFNRHCFMESARVMPNGKCSSYEEALALEQTELVKLLETRTEKVPPRAETVLPLFRRAQRRCYPLFLRRAQIMYYPSS